MEPDADHERYADDRLLHALLLHTFEPDAVQLREQRIQRAMSALAAPRLQRPHRAWAWRGAAAAAALLLVVAGILFLTSRSTYASLDDILGAFDRPGDRTFRIQVDPPDADARAPLNGATLYLRDGQSYLLQRVGPRAASVCDGYDGRQSWRIRGGALVETQSGPGAGGPGMPQPMAETLFEDLHPTLQRIRNAYTVETFDLAPLPGPAPQAAGGLRHLVARRNAHETKGPPLIEIWADPRTGMPRRILFDRAKFQGSPEPRRLTLDLTSDSPLPPDWFTPAAHLPPVSSRPATAPAARP